MTAPLAAYVCAFCKGELHRHKAGWWCPDCNTVGGKRVSKKRLAEQPLAAQVTRPVVRYSPEQQARGLAALYGDNYD